MPAFSNSPGLVSTLTRCIPTAPVPYKKSRCPQVTNSDVPQNRKLRFLSHLNALDPPTLDAPVASPDPLRASIQAWTSPR